jgi:rod shape-determining protein MreD
VKGTLVGIPVIALLAVAQSTILSHLSLLDGRPDLVLLAVVAWSLSGRSVEAMVWGWVGGVLIDLLSGLPLGVSAITLVGIAYLASLTEGRFWEGHVLVPVAAVLVASLLSLGVEMATLAVSGYPLQLGAALQRVVLPSVFLNLVLALPAAQLAAGLRDLLYPERVTI